MTYHIHLSGQVQGVGFRPFVYHLARKMNLNGWVSNENDGVHIELNVDTEILATFTQRIFEEAPPLAKILENQTKIVVEKHFSTFEIRHSTSKTQPNLLLTPDVATCQTCQNELLDKNNRRFGYPFITCTNCGVRYSIIEKLPYDRPNTVMKVVEQCEACLNEYNDVWNRMYYSQTNSCKDCGIEMNLYENGQMLNLDTKNSNEKIIQTIIKSWQNGKIVAIKGIGGYLLTCDTANKEAVQLLRKRKNRPSKPFALMYPDVEKLNEDAILTETVKKFLQSPESPIVLLPFKENIKQNIAIEEIAPNLRQIGVMLPYNPLFILLLNDFQKPIIATSANVSNSPIIFEDEIALQDLKEIADLILTHNRKILVPQDDSVVAINDFDNQPIMMRRSRGFAPTFIQNKLHLVEKTTLAMGAMMKSTFALSHQKNLYVSQYLGDLESYDTQENYKLLIKHFLNLLQTKPELIIIDKHSDYFSSQLGKAMAHQFQIPIVAVQHHFAHFAAVLAENTLLTSQEKILGVIWDGTGLGDDGAIWGGEFFIYQNQIFERKAHFPYFPMILGDKMPREPRISALCVFHQFENAIEFLENKFTKTEWQIYQQLLSKNNLQTSSIGRVFDAVASLLGLMDKASYEGEAAMRLETLAYQYFKKKSEIEMDWVENISFKTMLEGIVKDILEKKDIGLIAFKFHFILVKMIENQANTWQIKKITFSGGVFQNNLLVTLIKKYLSKDFDLYFHQQLSPNDENIAYGQLILGQENYLIH